MNKLILFAAVFSLPACAGQGPSYAPQAYYPTIEDYNYARPIQAGYYEEESYHDFSMGRLD